MRERMHFKWVQHVCRCMLSHMQVHVGGFTRYLNIMFFICLFLLLSFSGNTHGCSADKNRVIMKVRVCVMGGGVNGSRRAHHSVTLNIAAPTLEFLN